MKSFFKGTFSPPSFFVVIKHVSSNKVKEDVNGETFVFIADEPVFIIR